MSSLAGAKAVRCGLVTPGKLLDVSGMADLGKFSIVKLGNSNYGTWKFQMEMWEELRKDDGKQVRSEAIYYSSTRS